MSRPEGRTSWVAGPINAGVNAKMANKSVVRDAVSGVAKATK